MGYFSVKNGIQKKGKGLYLMQSLPIENVFSPTPHPPRVDSSKGISIYLTGRMERLLCNVDFYSKIKLEISSQVEVSNMYCVYV